MQYKSAKFWIICLEELNDKVENGGKCLILLFSSNLAKTFFKPKLIPLNTNSSEKLIVCFYNSLIHKQISLDA